MVVNGVDKPYAYMYVCSLGFIVGLCICFENVKYGFQA